MGFDQFARTRRHSQEAQVAMPPKFLAYLVILCFELMRKFGGGHRFTKIDLADTYNKIKLCPKEVGSQYTPWCAVTKRPAVWNFLGTRLLPKSIMDGLTSDLPGVAVCLNDILVSGASADEHLQNLKRLLQRLHEKGLLCQLQKCQFAQTKLEYLGHVLPRNGTEKGSKVNDVLLMPLPHDVSSLRWFLGFVQFYGNPYLHMPQLWPLHCIGSCTKAFRGAGKVNKTRFFKSWRLWRHQTRFCFTLTPPFQLVSLVMRLTLGSEPFCSTVSQMAVSGP